MAAAASRAALARPQACRLLQPALASQRIARQPFTTRSALLNGAQRTSDKTTAESSPSQSPKTGQQTPPPNMNPQYPKFSLDGLGLSKNMKILVYVLIGIWGTFETYFYGRAIHRWWTAKPEDKE
ncbi:uncharacterized protein F5Z01DRAFT_633276 [Emericellopsis atlantica]|uniref:Uncharacterized protein n=1 Tax=Emericellopsis atlantica TaxID=2614577 RepID=A0A9P7ZV60_9HYPO|nr:uncharacterized protein F5Z01DRAFT_633276 [Emericellopsis atlantica]KAG9258290.1 hypothetical protein F5Z01DRAFT_633276 [Emericellopsis atlantica]